MTAKYSDEDVQRLVEAATVAVSRISQSNPAAQQDLQQALVPFLPDPEEALIEKMAVAFYEGCCIPKDRRPYGNPLFPDDIGKGIRAALAVVKREGLPT